MNTPADPAPRIRVLGDHVCNKIAAGEVIERPASVFKELVENAVDAGADRIEVEILQGGRRAVCVTDNGHGMDRENALLSIERHATSKIRDVDDIEHIHTMGFRGEALAAIASVSRFLLTTRRAADLVGTRLRVDGGTLREVEETGCPAGTRVEVRDLFFNVPARRKFLRTEATELANIRAMFQVFAIAHPDVHLMLKVDGRLLHQYPVQERLRDRIADIYGGDILPHLCAVDFPQGDLRIHGFVGRPSLHRHDRADQVTLVNRRPATAPLLGYALREAYAESLPRGRHPVCFLHLDMPADWVDVNVHPTKREVRFGPSGLIRDALLQALSTALSPGGTLTSAPETTRLQPTRPPELAPAARQTSLPPPGLYPPLPRPIDPFMHPRPPPESPPPVFADTGPGAAAPGLWREAEYLGEVGDKFCLFRAGDGFLILHPAAALERILFERARTALDRGERHSQRLLLPETFDCPPQEARAIGERLSDLAALGFEAEAFGGGGFKIEAVPGWLGGAPAAETLRQLVRDTDAEAERLRNPQMLRERMARSCCRLAAVLSPPRGRDQVETLLRQLSACDMPYTTPYGRPTLLHTGLGELSRKFGLTS